MGIGRITVPSEAPTGNMAGSSRVVLAESEDGDDREQKETEQMLQIVDDLRCSTRERRGNCLTAEIGSEKDRLYGRMAEKGLLVRGPLGYMLPENSDLGLVEIPFKIRLGQAQRCN